MSKDIKTTGVVPTKSSAFASGQIGQQPMWFSSRRAHEINPICVTAAAAAARFKSIVCVSSDPFDAEVEIHPPGASYTSMVKITQDKFKNVFHSTSPVSVTTSAFVLPPLMHRPIGSIAYTQIAYSIMVQNDQCGGLPFGAIKIRTPGHVSLAFRDVKENTIEVFDPSGQSHASFQQQLLDHLFLGVLPSNKPKIIWVNYFNLQEQDKFCQTWIYWYIDQRIGGKSPEEIMTLLKSISPIQRFQMLAKYWNDLIRSGGGAIIRPMFRSHLIHN